MTNNLEQIDNDFDMLKEFMDIYIQLLPSCWDFGGKIIKKEQLPKFDYFKKNYGGNYCLAKPEFVESKYFYDTDKVTTYACSGLGAWRGCAYRYYGLWHGAKYFTGGNTDGNFTINYEYLNYCLKKIK